MAERALPVSVIVPAYNASRFLREAVDSVLAQDYRPLEVIVVDDGSTDDTALVAGGYGSRIVFARQPNRGSSAARNRGVALASGELYSFLDADDVFCAGKISLQVEALARDPALEIVFAHMLNFHDPSSAAPGPTASIPGVPATMLIRRASFQRVGPFDESVSLAEFIEWLIRARELGVREKLLSQVLLRRRIHDDNKSVRRRDERVEYVRLIKAALDRRRAAKKAAE